MPCSEYLIKVKSHKADVRAPVTLKTAILVINEDKRQLCFYKVEPDGRKPFPNIPIISSENISSVKKTKSLYTFDYVYQGDIYSATIQAPNFLLGEIHDICVEIFARSQYGSSCVKEDMKRRPRETDILGQSIFDLSKRPRTDIVGKGAIIDSASAAADAPATTTVPASLSVGGFPSALLGGTITQTPSFASGTCGASAPSSTATLTAVPTDIVDLKDFQPMKGNSRMLIREVNVGENSPCTPTSAMTLTFHSEDHEITVSVKPKLRTNETPNLNVEFRDERSGKGSDGGMTKTPSNISIIIHLH